MGRFAHLSLLLVLALTILLPLTVTSSTDASSVACDFEADMCGWQAVPSTGYTFHRHQGPTGDRTSGPRSDHTLAGREGSAGNNSGHFVFSSGWDARGPGEVASLLSPNLTLLQPSVMGVWYQMNGNGVGDLSLRLYKWTRRGRTRPSQLWSVSGRQGLRWRYKEVLLMKGRWQVEFQTTVKHNYGSDIALDDITITPQSEITTTELQTSPTPVRSSVTESTTTQHRTPSTPPHIYHSSSLSTITTSAPSSSRPKTSTQPSIPTPASSVTPSTTSSIVESSTASGTTTFSSTEPTPSTSMKPSTSTTATVGQTSTLPKTSQKTSPKSQTSVSTLSRISTSSSSHATTPSSPVTTTSLRKSTSVVTSPKTTVFKTSATKSSTTFTTSPKPQSTAEAGVKKTSTATQSQPASRTSTMPPSSAPTVTPTPSYHPQTVSPSVHSSQVGVVTSTVERLPTTSSTSPPASSHPTRSTAPPRTTKKEEGRVTNRPTKAPNAINSTNKKMVIGITVGVVMVSAVLIATVYAFVRSKSNYRLKKDKNQVAAQQEIVLQTINVHAPVSVKL